jgi:U3 small nucleolar RNA-associated protein 3
MTRKEKQSIKRRSTDAARLDNFNDIGDIGEFEQLAELSRKSGATKGKAGLGAGRGDFGDSDEEEDDGGNAMGAEDAAKALQRAVNAFAKSQSSADAKKKRDRDDDLAPVMDRKSLAAGNKKGKQASYMDASDDESDAYNNGDDSDDDMPARGKGKGSKRAKYDDDADADEDFDYHGGRARRPVPSGRMDADEDEDDGDADLLEEFARKKKEYVAKKKEHYAPQPRYGGIEESLPESGKRGITYEIMKNRGLTPHRKKENRNPRVKKRHAYEKAIVRRKGQVREVIKGAAGSYGGELTGIKAGISRSRKIGN